MNHFEARSEFLLVISLFFPLSSLQLVCGKGKKYPHAACSAHIIFCHRGRLIVLSVVGLLATKPIFNPGARGYRESP